MTVEYPGLPTWSLPADADYVEEDGAEHRGQFRFFTAIDGEASIVAAAGGEAVAVCQNNPRAGEATTLMHHGLSKVIAGAAIDPALAPVPVMSDNQGRAVAYDESADAICLGLAISPAGAAGELVTVILGIPGTRYATT